MANTQNLDLVKPLGTDHALVSVLNSNSDKIDAYAGAVNASLDGLRDGLGVLADGNTHAAITSGQFVYVKNHQTLPQGLYQATTNIAANGTLSTSNLTADPKGGLNTLFEQIGTLSSLINVRWTPEDLGQSAIFVRANGRTVTMNGYFLFSTPPTSNIKIGTITKYVPTDVVRIMCAFAEHAYDMPTGIGYLSIGSNGIVSVTPPAGNTKNAIYFNAAWTYQGAL